MDESDHTRLQTNPVSLIRGLDPVVIRKRLCALSEERHALLVLLRAALAARKGEDPPRPTTSP